MKLIYTVDYYQNPTGLTLAADRRPRLIELARQFSKHHRILILEDAAYRELGFDGCDLPSVKRYDTRNEFVIYTGTFSKSLSPGLKTGYALLPRDLVGPLLHLKSNHDFGSTNLIQHLIDQLMGSGVYRRHAEEVRAVYRGKRDAMVGALRREFADVPGVRWTVPAGGLYVWLTFPQTVDAGPNGPLVPASLEAGVLYVPGEFGHVPDENGFVQRNEARLCYGTASEAQIVEGVRRLRRAYRGIAPGVGKKSLAGAV